ncbi:MAG: group I truncated hemoglobin [Acidimicrobiia bacterium]
MGQSPVDRYGRVRLAQLVASFYADVLRSERLAHYFQHVPMAGLLEHQSMFMVMVMGGPTAFTPEDIEQVHRHLRISEDDFEEMLRLLEKSLLDYEVTLTDAAYVVEGYRKLQRHVVSDPPRRDDS